MVAEFDAVGLLCVAVEFHAADGVVADVKLARPFALQVLDGGLGVGLELDAAVEVVVGCTSCYFIAVVFGEAEVRIGGDVVAADGDVVHGELAVIGDDAMQAVTV